MRRYALALLLSFAFVLFVLSMWKMPQCHVAGAKNLTDNQRLERINAARGTIAQIWAGVVVLAGLGFTWYRIEVAREGQITERFTRAIDQLGATDEQGRKRLELRLGGIYALERIARDSEKDHWPIMEVLTAYVRENTPWKDDSQAQQEPRPEADIQAILTVLGRRTRWYGKGEEQYLDLRGTDVRGANLNGAHLEEAILVETHLEWAKLIDARLERAYLPGANLDNTTSLEVHLEGANLRGAHLYKAQLIKAYLNGAHLEEAILVETHLEWADLRGAYLEGAILWRAHLEGADLRGAHGLTPEQLASAYTDAETRLPDYLIAAQEADDSA